MLLAHCADPDPRPRRSRRDGAVLVEFALIALVLYLLLAAILTYGHLLWVGQTVQQAVDVGAQEIARMPFPPITDFGTISGSQTFKRQIYDEKDLVIHPSDLGQQSLADYAASLPLLNRLLVGAMVFDPDNNVYRYPGALVMNSSTQVETVLIPLVDYATNTIQWRFPVEEIQSNGVGPFSVNASDPSNPSFIPGMVALRINYPFQSATLSGFRPNPAGPFEPNGTNVIPADDSSLSEGTLPPGYTLVVPSNAGMGPESGRYGLGKQIALVKPTGVRPYRTVISVQAIYRREVFGPPQP